MATPQRRTAGLGKLALGFLGVLATLGYMAMAPGLWKLAVFALALAALGFAAAVWGVDSRDGRDW